MIAIGLLILGILFIVTAIIDCKRMERWVRRDASDSDKQPMFMVRGIDGDSSNIGATRWIIGVIIIIFVLIVQISVYINLMSKESDYKVFDAKKEILIERQKNLVEQLKFEAQKYVNYEKEIFTALKPDNTQILFNAYPDLKAYEPIRLVMEQMTRLSDDIIKLELEKQEIRATFININSNVFVMFRSHYE